MHRIVSLKPLTGSDICAKSSLLEERSFMTLTAIAVVGPNGSGKTSLAAKLARATDGAIVNADKTYVFRGFPIGTGLADTLKEPGVERHLYELLEPDEPLFSTDTYVGMVREVCADLSRRGRTPIIEGGSTTFVPALLDSNAETPFIRRIVGLMPPHESVFRRLARKRVDIALQEGLIEETRRGLERYRDTLLMRTCRAITPIIRHLDGAIGLDAAKQEMVDGCIEYARLQMAAFARFPEIEWIPCGRADIGHVLSR